MDFCCPAYLIHQAQVLVGLLFLRKTHLVRWAVCAYGVETLIWFRVAGFLAVKLVVRSILDALINSQLCSNLTVLPWATVWSARG